MGQAARARGAFGERLAAEWYVRNGYQVLARNWRCRAGELDLVVADDHTMVFVEVKARADGRFGGALEAVGPAKARRVRRLAAAWLAESGQRRPDVRFDLVAVTGAAVDVVQDAW